MSLRVFQCGARLFLDLFVTCTESLSRRNVVLCTESLSRRVLHSCITTSNTRTSHTHVHAHTRA